MAKLKTLHDFFTWWLMRHGLNGVVHDPSKRYYGSDLDEVYDMMPSQCEGVRELTWGGWLEEKTFTTYTLTPKALAHIAKHNSKKKGTSEK